MPSLEDINAYWSNEFDLLEDCPTCFICGTAYGLEVCHLISKSLCGKNEVNNLVLLCHNHHRQAPNIAVDKCIMLNWMYRENQKYSVTFNLEYITIDDLKKSFNHLYSRLSAVYDENYITFESIHSFLEYSFSKNTLFPSGHHKSNENTLILYLNYLSNYKNLEKDFLSFINIK